MWFDVCCINARPSCTTLSVQQRFEKDTYVYVCVCIYVRIYIYTHLRILAQGVCESPNSFEYSCYRAIVHSWHRWHFPLPGTMQAKPWNSKIIGKRHFKVKLRENDRFEFSETRSNNFFRNYWITMKPELIEKIIITYTTFLYFSISLFALIKNYTSTNL